MPALPPWAMKALLGLVGAAVLMAAGAAAWHKFPGIGPAAVQQRLTGERDKARETAKANRELAIAWAKSAGKSEGLRKREKATARTAVNEEAKACNARVVEARRSALAIRSITRQESPRDPQGCPIRQLVPSDRLRDALQPTPAPR